MAATARQHGKRRHLVYPQRIGQEEPGAKQRTMAAPAQQPAAALAVGTCHRGVPDEDQARLTLSGRAGGRARLAENSSSA
jgi:hypothetical protein